jgi:hypothetical protein
MHVLPGMSYSDIKEMDWPELSKWRETAINLFKRVHGDIDG